jgi:hypothetical protein
MESGAINLRHFVAARCQRRKFAHNDFQESRKTKQVRKKFPDHRAHVRSAILERQWGVWET